MNHPSAIKHHSSGNLQPLYRATWILSLVMLFIIPTQILIYVLAPPPESVAGFFQLFSRNPFLGLLSLDFLYLFNNIIVAVIYVALFSLLFRERPATSILALLFGLIGVACYYPSNPAFEMMTLSHQFSQAAAESQHLYLSAGEAVMAAYTGTAFNTYYVLSTLCLLLFSYALLKSPQFKGSIGLWGLASGFFMIIPSSAGTIGIIFSLLSLIPWVVFVALLMVHFRKLA